MPVDFSIPNIDQHPLRYTPLERVIEAILFQREMERNKETGYVHGTLPTALLIGDAVMSLLTKPSE